MNHYSFDMIEIGTTESFQAHISEESMLHFYEIVKDENPLHNQTDYAKRKGYKDRVVYGMLTASYLSTLAGVYLPGENSLIQSVETKMIKPVYVGDSLKITGKVVEKSKSLPIIVVSAIIKNQDDEVVMRGKIQIGVSE